MVELNDASHVTYFTDRDAEWSIDNLRTQSILNNYSLSIQDRIALYKKIRSEPGSYAWYRQLQQFMGSSADTLQDPVAFSRQPSAFQQRPVKSTSALGDMTEEIPFAG